MMGLIQIQTKFIKQLVRPLIKDSIVLSAVVSNCR